MVSIYFLERNNVPFYIGKTKNYVFERLTQHKKKFGPNIEIFLLDEIPSYEWKFWEKHYISLFKSWGFKLENKNNGGGGPTNHSKETIILMKRILSSDTKQKMRKPKHTFESKNKISNSQKGKSKSEVFKLGLRNNKLRGSKISKSISVPINQYNLNGEFVKEWESQKNAEMFYNPKLTHPDNIGNVCRGKGKTAYGFIWKFKET